MDKVIIYIQGQGGNADESKHYEALFENQKVIGIDYKSETPWEVAEEFPKLYDVCKTFFFQKPYSRFLMMVQRRCCW